MILLLSLLEKDACGLHPEKGILLKGNASRKLMPEQEFIVFSLRWRRDFLIPSAEIFPLKTKKWNAKNNKFRLTSKRHCGIIVKHCVGEVSEWFKEPVLKTGDSERDRGFESHLLRWKIK